MREKSNPAGLNSQHANCTAFVQFWAGNTVDRVEKKKRLRKHTVCQSTTVKNNWTHQLMAVQQEYEGSKHAWS